MWACLRPFSLGHGSLAWAHEHVIALVACLNQRIICKLNKIVRRKKKVISSKMPIYAHGVNSSFNKKQNVIKYYNIVKNK